MPVGVGVKDSNLKTDLLYNEFIVYDIAQVNKFLVDVIISASKSSIRRYVITEKPLLGPSPG